MKTFITTGLVLITLVFISTESSAQRHYRSGRQSYRGSQHYYSPYNYYRSSRISVGLSLPFGALRLHVGNNPYYYHQGIFYRPWTNGYMIAPPPFGIVVPAIPGGSVLVIRGSRRYFYYSGTYYMPLPGVNSGYEVVESPDPEDTAPGKETGVAYEKIVIEGKTYYKKDDTYYKAVVDDNGEIRYEEVGQSEN